MTLHARIDLATFRLAPGSHGSQFTGEACLVELSNLIAAKQVDVPAEQMPACPLKRVAFADDHPSISRVIRAFAIGLNDAWQPEDRQRLLPYAPRLLRRRSFASRDAARDAARAATVERLQPTVAALRDSALVLLDEMIAVGKVAS